jgi:hypothetical protein
VGPQLHFCRNELPLHQKDRGITNSKRLTSRGNHISTNGDGHLCTDDSPAAAIIPACAPLQGEPRPPSPYGGRQQAIKAKESEVRRQVALTVSPAEATTSAVGSLTSADDHLNTDDNGHLCASTVPASGGRASAHEEVFAPVLTAGVRTRPSKNAAPTRTAYDVLYDLPVRLVSQEKSWMWPTCAWRDRSPCGGRAATLRPSGRRRCRRHQSCPGRGARHAAANSVTDSERLSPPNTEGRSGPLPTRRRVPTRRTLLPSTDDEHP